MNLGDRVETRFGTGTIVGRDLLKYKKIGQEQYWHVKLNWQKEYEDPYKFLKKELR